MASDDESTDPGYRSRSQSRRARRKKQTNQKKQQMPSIQEQQQQQQSARAQASANTESRNDQGQTQSETQLVENLPNQSKPGAMQPFEWIGPDSTSMNGPVTYAKAMRGEIPMRPGNPEQSLETGYKPGQEGKKSGESDLMDQEGLKLRIELNIDIEIELKARIHGDLTLALL